MTLLCVVESHDSIDIEFEASEEQAELIKRGADPAEVIPGLYGIAQEEYARRAGMVMTVDPKENWLFSDTVAILESCGWTVREGRQDGSRCVELGWKSPLGEDFTATIRFGDNWDFLENLGRYATSLGSDIRAGRISCPADCVREVCNRMHETERALWALYGYS